MGRNQNMCGKSNIKRKTSPKRTSQLFRLLYRETRFEIKTNRRIRNRTYGGVRGRNFSIKRNSSYSICEKQKPDDPHAISRGGILGGCRHVCVSGSQYP